MVEQLRRPTIVYLAEIYAAREKNTIGISSADLAAQIPGAKFYPTFAEIEAELRRIARPGDIILTVGAGDVFRIGEHLLGIRRTTRIESARLEANCIKSCRLSAGSFFAPKSKRFLRKDIFCDSGE